MDPNRLLSSRLSPPAQASNSANRYLRSSAIKRHRKLRPSLSINQHSRDTKEAGAREELPHLIDDHEPSLISRPTVIWAIS